MGSNPRRSGFSRRAQYSLFTGYVVAGAGALLGALLLAISLYDPRAMSGPRSLATDAISPLGEATAKGREHRRSLFEGVSAYIAAGSKNADLEHELRIARVKLAEAQAVRDENARLKQLAGLREKAPSVVTTARLIGSTSTSTRRVAFLSAGRADGVHSGMPVRSPLGLVGRVLETGSYSSRVLLLTDSESIVPVRRAKDNVVAFAEGRADGTLNIRLINLGINPLKPGDVFVTSGSGGIFEPGIAVAVVVKVTKDGAIGRVLSDPLATSFVIVQPAWHPEAAAALERPVTRSAPMMAQPAPAQ
jgi:rod shape-determining protein MreC